MNLYDSHAHLDQLEDVAQALTEARDAGVNGILAVSVDLASSRKNLELARRHADDQLLVGLGVHPGEIDPEEWPQALDFLRENISQAQVIGEIGLDFWYKGVRKDQAKKDEQRNVFRRQLELARDHDKPVVIHSRGAWAQCLEIVRSVGVDKGVFHWYSGPLDVMQEILSQGFYVSCTPSLAYSPQAQEAMRQAPIERTLIETDCPVYYKNEDGTGFRAAPKDVIKTFDLYCQLKDCDPRSAADILNQNARNVFSFL